MTILDIAQEMKGKLRDGYDASQAGGAAQTSNMSYGTATADSVNGFVTIIMDNAVADGSAYDPADYEFTVACDSPISNGDRVAYIVIDGVGKAISLGGLTDMATTAETNAATAISIANATGQYFFHDSNGAHVSTVANNPSSGRNVTLNSTGLLFRNNTTNLAYFQPNSIALGMNCEVPTLSNPTASVSITLLNQIALAAKFLSYIGPAGGAMAGVGLDIDSEILQVKNLKATGGGVFSGDVGSNNYYDKFGNASMRGAAATLTNSAVANIGTSYSVVTMGNSIVATHSDLFAKYGTAGIQCKKDGTVLVSATLYCSGINYSNNVAIQIRKGSSTSVAEVAVGGTMGTNNVTTANITPRAIPVAANDVIYLYAKASSAVTSGIVADGATLTVQYM